MIHSYDCYSMCSLTDDTFHFNNTDNTCSIILLQYKYHVYVCVTMTINVYEYKMLLPLLVLVLRFLVTTFTHCSMILLWVDTNKKIQTQVTLVVVGDWMCIIILCGSGMLLVTYVCACKFINQLLTVINLSIRWQIP